MKIVIDKIRAICYYYSLFISVEESLILNIDSKLILQSLSSYLIMLLDLNSYSIINEEYRFYK